MEAPAAAPAPAPAEHQHQPPAKRAKLDDPAGAAAAAEEAALRIVSPKLLASGPELSARYWAAEPYRHTVMTDVFDPALLARVRDEIINNVNATYKETDLFKVFQTGGYAGHGNSSCSLGLLWHGWAGSWRRPWAPINEQRLRRCQGVGEWAMSEDISAPHRPAVLPQARGRCVGGG